MPHQILIEPSPRDADIAIASINSEGNLGNLNEYVLTEYGYSENDLPNAEQLQYGFGAIPNTKGKPILFVVTIDGRRDTKDVLEENLFNTLTEFRGWFRGKKLWLPLMGTGAGNLSMKESYEITARVINKFSSIYSIEFSLIISLPNSNSSRVFRDLLLQSDNSENVEDFVKKLNTNFYLAGAFWSGEDQVGRFLSEGIWEKGQEDDSYSEVINNIKKNDIIILKSAFSSNSESILRIKAIGLVIFPSEDGASIEVDWKIKNLNIDIPVLGKYRRTIARVSNDDTKTILSTLDFHLWERLLFTPSTIAEPLLTLEHKIAGLTSDSEKGDDYLHIDKDIRAFARVIAAKNFEPPLAIALFGKWGAGKSFFMRKLKEQVEEFSQREANGMYCKMHL